VLSAIVHTPFCAILAPETISFPVREEQLLVWLSFIRWARMPTKKHEAPEDRTGNHEDRSDERSALDEHELVSLAAWSS
jgi:hypothetical protein